MIRVSRIAVAGRTFQVGLAVWLGLVALGTATGQERWEDITDPAERARLYDELARDVDELEKRLGIIKRAARLAAPSVVHIEARKPREDSFTSSGEVEEAGSGVIASLGGENYVLTNRHVIRNALPENIDIHLHDGRIVHPTRTWDDPETDVAVMSLPQQGLMAARLGDSSRIEIGDFVLAVGSPFGLSKSITYGIVSAKGRYDLKLGAGEVVYQNFLQTDAAINPGNSGGPLLNLRGEVVGINTAIASNSGGNEGIGFSIPINIVVQIARQLITTGTARRAFLGVSLDRDYDETTAYNDTLRIRGARVSSITDDSPAQTAGVQVGDIVVAFDGIRIKDDAHLINVVGLTEVGRDVEVVVLRDSQFRRFRVNLGDRSAFSARR